MSAVRGWMRVTAALPSLLLVVFAFGVGRWFGLQTELHAPDVAVEEVAEAGGGGADDGHEGHGHAEAEEVTTYICPMHPQVRQDEFGTCPICFMDLVELEGGADDDPNVVPASEALDRAGVRTERVRRAPVRHSFEVWGRVGESEAGQSRVTAWVAGRVERLDVDAVGRTLRRGQRVARVWSPEVGAASEALVAALASHEAALARGRERGFEDLVEASRARLRALGVDERTIETMVREREVIDTVSIRADVGGTVMERAVRVGDWVERGTALVELSDLRAVWVQVEIPESELERVRVGQRVEVVPAGGSGAREGTVTFVDPVVDPSRRVARARVEVENADGALRADEWVRARLEVEQEGRAPVSVPRTAVLWTGTRSLVYVLDPSVDPAVYQPVEVVTGAVDAERVEIVEGIFPGEQVVVHGAFVIDASLQIRGGPSMMTRTPPADEEVGHAHE